MIFFSFIQNKKMWMIIFGLSVGLVKLALTLLLTVEKPTYIKHFSTATYLNSFDGALASFQSL